MKWDLSDKDYPQIDIKENHVVGLSEWIEKIATLSVAYGGKWNTLVADLWPNDNYSRLIGHVQMNDVAIGYDTGFRVCAYIENEGIVGDYGDDIPLIKDWLTDAVKNKKTNKLLTDLSQKNSFDIRLTSWGIGEKGEMKDLIKIVYKQI